MNKKKSTALLALIIVIILIIAVSSIIYITYIAKLQLEIDVSNETYNINQTLEYTVYLVNNNFFDMGFDPDECSEWVYMWKENPENKSMLSGSTGSIHIGVRRFDKTEISSGASHMSFILPTLIEPENCTGKYYLQAEVNYDGSHLKSNIASFSVYI